MIYFTKYANDKFEILNKYKVFITKEEVEEAVKAPDKITAKDRYWRAEKDDLKVFYRQEENIKKVVTFFPAHNK
ncbi:hypothetical protein COT99_04445 [Candidatus Falkowbacteria bacterium CG10_big_fil_rev_8_21_14_0_10_43_10]|uniref:DUF4258 domain-containing protein n=1 Tax=Candidatus Falkowbacteria bacterium CG10_big_fil_rev_8_21_14_0_10_43_10 TaxID=1974567 RepID=A0A2H0V128_9BACT|nr:MAG: hypothetical protein COT99_04445 [Candidatus Falkowbacteria bacterium CG10_big_fil_rev_8_21_14_0_10_43_10]